MTTATTTATLTRPAGSHWLSTEHQRGGELAKEELYPELTLEGLPRVAGPIEVRYSVDRYASSDGHWCDWRIILRDVKPMKGIGDAGRHAIDAAAEPVIRAWLESDAYKESRQQAAAYMLRRLMVDESNHLNQVTIENMRAELERHRDELTIEAAGFLENAIEGYRIALRGLNAATSSDL